MGKPLICTENLFSLQQFAGHSIGATADNAGADPFKVGTFRRGRLNQWATGDGSSASVYVGCDRVRTVNFLALDRNTSIPAGTDVRLWVYGSFDGTGDFEEPLGGSGIATPLPADVVPGSSLLDPPKWIKTEEGAYITRFPTVSGGSFRIYVATQGANYGVGGVYLGLAHEPVYPRMPFDDESMYNQRGEVRRGVPDADIRFGRTFMWNQLLSDEAEWSELRKVRQHLKRGYPGWVVPDQEKAERAGMFYASEFTAPFSESPIGRTVSLSLEEYDPVKL